MTGLKRIGIMILIGILALDTMMIGFGLGRRFADAKHATQCAEPPQEAWRDRPAGR